MNHERIDETPRHHDASRGASGADCFHAVTVFASAADAATDSNSAFEQRDDFGFELDGPVRIPWVFNGQNKMFFMANYEALRRRQNTQSIYTVPTAAMFSGDFSAPGLNTIYDPTTKAPFEGNKIPSSRIDPVSST